MTQLPPHHTTDLLIARTGRLIDREGEIISVGAFILELLMATNDDVKAEYAKTKQAIIDDQVSDQAVVDGLDAIIAGLKDGSMSNADIIAGLQDLQTQIKPVTSVTAPPQ